MQERQVPVGTPAMNRPCCAGPWLCGIGSLCRALGQLGGLWGALATLPAGVPRRQPLTGQFRFFSSLLGRIFLLALTVPWGKASLCRTPNHFHPCVHCCRRSDPHPHHSAIVSGPFRFLHRFK